MKKATALILILILARTYSFAGDNSIFFPTFSLLKMDSTSYLTEKDLKDSVNTVFINFSPTCDHCERTIKSILENISKFTETQFVLSSFEDFAAIRKFYFDNGLNSFTTVFIGQETDYSLTKQIKYSSFPCLILFDKNKKYLKKIDQESSAKELLKAFKIKQ
jgi:thiol-disulfide isomerase/thioredoxin